MTGSAHSRVWIPNQVWSPMPVWAARDLGRHPWQTLATALTLFGLALLLGGTQLVHQAFRDTTTHLLAGAPAIVVRRAAPTGWVPLPIHPALEAAAGVPGVLSPHARLWGHARVSGQTVTVMAMLERSDDAAGAGLFPDTADLLPGEVLAGGGLAPLLSGDTLIFDEQPQRAYTAVRRLSADTAMAVHDTVLMHPEDARALLGIPPGSASDLAIDVFHAEEIEALSRDLAKAFPWPVKISSRTKAAGRLAAGEERTATLATLAYAPALLALLVLGLAGAVGGERGRAQAGLLRALGWTGGDFLRLALWRWAWLSLPSVALGLAAAYTLTFSPGIRWMGPILFGWTTPPPPLHLSSAGSPLVLVQVAALVLLPHLAIVVATGLRHTTTDPQTLMEDGP